MAEKKDVKYSKGFNFDTNQLEYTFQIKRKRNWWWLLLLLLPLLLLIRCKHDITVRAIDDSEEYPIEGLTVNAEYKSRFLFDDGRLFAKRENKKSEVTDTAGVAVFKDVECSVYSYLFFFLDKIRFTVDEDCYAQKDSPVKRNLHFTRNVKLRLTPKRTDVTWHVVDKETLEDLAVAQVEAVYQLGASVGTVKGVTDPSGMVTFKDVPECGIFRRIKARRHEYNDTILAEKVVRIVMANSDSALIKLTPKKDRITTINCDLVMCIDNTHSMSELINTVKNNALTFYSDLSNHCSSMGKKLIDVNIRVVSLGDFGDSQLVCSEFFGIPKQETDYHAFVNNVRLTDGGDGPEDGLEALAVCMGSGWHKTDQVRHVIVVYTDAGAHPLGFNKSSKFYPSGMPSNFVELTAMWNAMDFEAKRLILFAPDSAPWDLISTQWSNVTRESENLKSVLSGKGYTDILDAISESL